MLGSRGYNNPTNGPIPISSAVISRDAVALHVECSAPGDFLLVEELRVRSVLVRCPSLSQLDVTARLAIPLGRRPAHR